MYYFLFDYNMCSIFYEKSDVIKYLNITPSLKQMATSMFLGFLCGSMIYEMSELEKLIPKYFRTVYKYKCFKNDQLITVKVIDNGPLFLKPVSSNHKKIYIANEIFDEIIRKKNLKCDEYVIYDRDASRFKHNHIYINNKTTT